MPSLDHSKVMQGTVVYGLSDTGALVVDTDMIAAFPQASEPFNGTPMPAACFMITLRRGLCGPSTVVQATAGSTSLIIPFGISITTGEFKVSAAGWVVAGVGLPGALGQQAGRRAARLSGFAVVLMLTVVTIPAQTSLPRARLRPLLQVQERD